MNKRKATAVSGLLQAATGIEGWFMKSIPFLKLELQALCLVANVKARTLGISQSKEKEMAPSVAIGKE